MLNTFLRRQNQLSCLPCIEYFGLTIAGSVLVCRNVNIKSVNIKSVNIKSVNIKSVFLWYRSQRDVYLFCKFGMTFLRLRLGFVHPLQDVALHQCLPLSSVCCVPNPGGSLLLCYVILPSSASSSFDLFPLLGCHSVKRLVRLLVFSFAICPAHFQACLREPKM